MKERIKVALAQFTPVLGDVAANVGRATELAREAAGRGAGLVVFPELALTGYFVKDLAAEVAHPVTAAEFDPLARLSERAAVVAGLIEAGPGQAIYNAAALWHGGAARAVHRKIYLPTYGLFDEARHVARGRQLRAYDSPFGRLGLLICEDIWHPSTVYVMAQDGAELLVVISASPARFDAGGSRTTTIWSELLRTHALLNSMHVVFVNRVGFEDGVSFWGGSRIIAPDGTVLAEAPLFDESLTIGEVDRRDVLRERMRSHHVWEEDPELTLRALGDALERRRSAEARVEAEVRVKGGPGWKERPV